jgi:signal transduction histidine kinase
MPGGTAVSNALSMRNRLLAIPSLVMIIAIYLPFAVPNLVSGFADHWAIVAVGAYLCLSMVSRNLWLGDRVPESVQTVWAATDWIPWYYSSHLVHGDMPITLAAFAVVGEITMVGWHRRRGVYHWLLGSLATVVAPWLDGRSHRLGPYLVQWALPVIPGLVFIYVFIYMAGRMEEHRQEADRARKAAELANDQLREYAAQVEEVAILRERNRLARDVHDTIAHGFTSIHMQMELIEALLQHNPAEAAVRMAQVRDQVRESLDEVRRSVHALRPLQVEQHVGISAIRQLVETFRRTTGVAADLAHTGTPRELPAAHELCLYRTAQEGLTNAFRHGRAQRARIRIDYSDDRVMLAVEDDGAGTPPAVTGGGLGIVGVRERAAVLGGKVTAGPAATGGFVLQVTLPLVRGTAMAQEVVS